MEYTLLILALVAISAALYFFATRRRKDSDAPTEEAPSEAADAPHGEPAPAPPADYTGMKTRQLCKALLGSLNCRVEEDEEEPERMEFVFQGETFCLIASDDCLLATVYDFSWGNISLDDIDDVARLRKVINTVNFRFGGLCVVYTINTESNKMVVHTKRQFLITPEIPNINDYMTAMLTGFFEVQRALTHELDRLRMGGKEQ